MALTEPHVLIAWPLFINLHFPLSLGKANGVFVRIFCSVEVELLPRGRDVLMVSKGSREYGWPMVVGTKLAQSELMLPAGLDINAICRNDLRLRTNLNLPVRNRAY